MNSSAESGAPGVQNSFRVNNFDLLRIVAAIQVLVIHSMARFGIPVPAGLRWLEWFPGVPIFFVISGFLVSASFERQPNVLRYFRNRFLRIYPGLWVCVIITALVTTALGYRRAHLMDFVWLPAQLVGFIYTPDFLKHFGAGTYNGALWTIPIELQFYLMLPLVYLGIKQTNLRKTLVPVLMASFIVITLVISYTSPSFNTQHETSVDKLIRYTFISSFYLFLLGIALQRAHASASKWIAGKGVYWVIGYTLLRLALPADLPPSLMVLSYMVLGVSAVSLAYTLPRAGEMLLRGQDISYGVYIYHGLVINLLIDFKVRRGLYEIPIVLIATILLGALSWKLVEQPFLRKKRSDAAPRREPLAPQVPEPESALGPGA